ncbi:MAG: thioredoxin family protein [Verrucomicrobiae bacterium]|nr:thioredoxin family protein [Verrucomicrobiae bacterium]
MQLTVIGPGCARCQTLAKLTEQAAQELGLEYELIKVTDLRQIMALGVMMTPALAINGTVRVVGKVPSLAELKTLLRQAAEAQKAG